MLTINNTVEGYLKDIEIKGNTWQDSENLADIRSVGTKVEGQELYEIPVLSTGKNLLNINSLGTYYGVTFSFEKNVLSVKGTGTVSILKKYSIKHLVEEGRTYVLTSKSKNSNVGIIDGSSVTSIGGAFVAGNDVCIYFQIREGVVVNETIELQLEEGTQATPYEPYQEDKLTILSPVQLEKVGNVADRIVCKDGVYGVEKNIESYTFDGTETYRTWGGTTSLPNTNTYTVTIPNVYADSDSYKITSTTQGLLSSINPSELNKVDVEASTLKSSSFYCRLLKNNSSTVEAVQSYLRGRVVLYITTQPTFIPLPHDQQIKLRTFADRTNISFDTEIQPTLKASVPKSLGATVNSHTTQIDNLNKELDRVKKLEESTVSTVTSDKGFTTVSETSGGYFEDVKIEGKTLVNLWNGTNNGFSSEIMHCCKPLTTYTIYFIAGDGEGQINYQYKNISDKTHGDSILYHSATSTDKIILTTIKTKEDSKNICIYSPSNKVNFANLLILEGDHTDKDISYFEGLKSVGQDVEEVSVESSGSYKDILHRDGYKAEYNTSGNIVSIVGGGNMFGEVVKVKPNTSYVVKFNENSTFNPRIYGYTYTPKCPVATLHQQAIIQTNSLDKDYTITFTTLPNVNYLFIGRYNGQEFNTNYQFKYASTGIEVVFNKDKKQILYYNPNTQTWEKPVLREWDSIEKHSNGKYYYHKRSGEVVLNGSENYNVQSDFANQVNTIGFRTPNIVNGNTGSGTDIDICSHFNIVNQNTLHNSDIEAITQGYNGIYFRINRTRLSTQDVEGFKAWLQTNNVTVVYQLAQEEVYECTNLDLITYSGETNLIVNSGAIQPRLELKVLSNVSNVVKLLQEKVSILENNTSSYIVTQNRLQLASTYAADSVTFKVDYASAFDNRSVDGYNPDLYNLILNNILVGKDNYDYNKMFSIILDYASWDQISWEQFDELVLLMDIQHNPPIEIPEEDYTEEEIPEI